MSDRTEHLAFVSTTDALAGIFADQEFVFASHAHDAAHVAGLAPHVNGHGCLGPRPDGVLHRDGIHTGRIIHVYDHRNGAHGQNGDGRGHVGKRGHEDFVARADVQSGQRCGERVRSTRGHAHIFRVCVFSPSFFKTVAFTSFMVAEHLAALDNVSDRICFFFTDN